MIGRWRSSGRELDDPEAHDLVGDAQAAIDLAQELGRAVELQRDEARMVQRSQHRRPQERAVRQVKGPPGFLGGQPEGLPGDRPRAARPRPLAEASVLEIDH